MVLVELNDDVIGAVTIVHVEVEDANPQVGQIHGGDHQAVQAAESSSVGVASVMEAACWADGPNTVAQRFLSGRKHAARGVGQAGSNVGPVVAETVFYPTVEQVIHKHRIMGSLDLCPRYRFKSANVEWNTQCLPTLKRELGLSR